MPRINENQGVQKHISNTSATTPQINNGSSPNQKPAPNAANATTLRNDVQNYGDGQKTKLNNSFETKDKRDNSPLIGGTAGSTAAQFELSEQKVRDAGIIKVKGDAATPKDFVNNVERDIQKLAPNSKLERRPTNSPYYEKVWDQMYGKDTLAVVRKPEQGFPSQQNPRIGGHEQGYRLLDQLHNNPNEVTINYEANNAYANPRVNENAVGKVTSPGKGSAVDIFYDPNLSVGLPVKNSQGNLVNKPVDSAIILGHEFGHASHEQRGTDSNISNDLAQNWNKNKSQLMGTQGKENIFSGDGKFYRENDNKGILLREEFRNVGMNGHRYGNEPTENSLRTELGIPEKRVSYQNQSSVTEITPNQARLATLSTKAQTFSDNVVDGVRGSRNSALIGAGFGLVTAVAQGKDVQGVVGDTVLGAGTGVAQEVIQKVVNGASSTTSGMTNGVLRTAVSQVKGAAIAGAIINTGFAIYDQMDNLKNDATRSQAVGTIAGEAAVGAASGAAGAYAGALAGAAIGSIVPGVGTVIGGVVGFAVGAGAGYLADKGLRGLGVDKAIAGAVTATIDTVSNVAQQAGQKIGEVADGAKNFLSSAGNTLSSIFG